MAAFDLDGTLTRGGSVLPFLIAVRGLLPVLAACCRTLPLLVRGALSGGVAADRAKERLFVRLLGGQDAARLDRIGAAFAQRHLQRRLRTDTVARLRAHRGRGDLVLVVSASPECYVRPMAGLLGADGVLATRLAVGGGLLTGGYEGQNNRGAEKYARVVGWLRANGLSGGPAEQPELWAYGNSRGDLRLLAAADHGVDAGRLGPLGRLRAFPRLATLPPLPPLAGTDGGAGSP